MKYLDWIGSSQKDFNKLPLEIRESTLYALYQVQNGMHPRHAKVLKGFGDAGVIEIKESDKSGTYRIVYTVKMTGIVFVLHAFQKKSKHGIETPKKEIDLIRNRLKQAVEVYKNEYKDRIKL